MPFPIMAVLAAATLAMQAKAESEKKAPMSPLPEKPQMAPIEPTFQQAVRGSMDSALQGQQQPSFSDQVRQTMDSRVTDQLGASPLKADSMLLSDVMAKPPEIDVNKIDINSQFNPSTVTPPPQQKASIFGDMTGSEKAMVGAQVMSEVFKRPPGPNPPGLPGSSFSPMTPQFNRRY